MTARVRSRRAVRAVGVVALAAAVAAGMGIAASSHTPGREGGPDWRMIGHDAAGSRNQGHERAIRRSNVSRLAPKWTAPTAGDVSATPAVVGRSVYVPDWGGKLWKLDGRTGAVQWSRSIAEYNGIAGSFSRTSPAVDGGVVYVGDQNGAHLMAVSARTGHLRWITRIDAHKWAILSSSPVIKGNIVVIGTSSRENLQSEDPCCTFRSSVTALDKRSGRVIWKTYMLPENGGVPGGFAGAGIVNPPAVSHAGGGLVIVGTNSHNSLPQAARECLGGDFDGIPPDLIDTWSESCFPEGDYFSSVVALDLRDGDVRWSYRVAGTNAWEDACGGLPATVTWCADPRDLAQWDVLGSGANVFRTRVAGRTREVVGMGSRTGIYRLFDAASGKLLWATLVGPQFGIQWGTATDGDRIYVPIANPTRRPYLLEQSGTPTTGGSWAALDPATGRILWQTAVPGGADGLGPPTVANGVVYAGSMARTGDQMYALDTRSGELLWRYAAGATVNAGPAVSRGTVYWGSGYVRGGGTASSTFHAFSIGGR